jgi:hypothetical protein
MTYTLLAAIQPFILRFGNLAGYSLYIRDVWILAGKNNTTTVEPETFSILSFQIPSTPTGLILFWFVDRILKERI